MTTPENWPPENAPDWLKEQLASMPAPTPDMDPAPLSPEEWDKSVADAVERETLKSIPKSYQWAMAGAPELAARVKEIDVAGATMTVDALLETAPIHHRILFTGAADAGKTSLACAMLRQWVRRHRRRAAFFHAHRLGMARIQTKAGTGEAPIVEQAMTVPLALLDDVGAERDTANNAMLDIVFERHAEDVPMWITTGWTSAEISQRYGAGFLRRITQRALIIRVGK